MNLLSSLRRRSFEAACTVEIERSAESLHAHVVIDGDCELQAGRRGVGAQSSDRGAIRRAHFRPPEGDDHARGPAGATLDAPGR